jgi:2'-5' RNA ligase
MQTIRSFIAAEIVPPLKVKIVQIVNGLKQQIAEGIRWVTEENIHLTFKFFGDIQQDKLTILANSLQAVTAKMSPIGITLAELGAFPDHRRPRVVWIGIRENPDLSKLANIIEDLAIKSGVKTEERAFSAHITLGRVGRPADTLDILKIGDTISLTKVGEIGSQTIDELIIFRSELQKEGPLYTPIYSFQLGK